MKKVSRARLALYSAGGVLVLLLGSSAAFGFPWNMDMVFQAALRPFKHEMRSPAPGTLPVVGGELEWDDRTVERPGPTPEALAQGKELFGIYCAVCHAADAHGSGIVGVKFPMAAPDLLLDRPPEYIYTRIREGSVFMPSYAEHLSPAESWAVVNYIKSLDEIAGSEENEN